MTDFASNRIEKPLSLTFSSNAMFDGGLYLRISAIGAQKLAQVTLFINSGRAQFSLDLSPDEAQNLGRELVCLSDLLTSALGRREQ